MSDNTQLTTLGNLDPNLASALCYVPIMSINLIASAAFFFTETENMRVKYHGAQGLLTVGSIFVSAIVFSVVYVLGVIIGAVLDGILGTDGLISLLFTMGLLLLTLLYVAVLFIGPIALAFFAFQGGNTKLPIIGGLAEKMAGLEPGWND